MPRLHEPFKMHLHPELLHKINGLSIAIKLHHTIKPDDDAIDKVNEAKTRHPEPTWEDVIDVLSEAYKVIAQLKEDPRRY